MNIAELQVPKSEGYKTSVAYWIGFLRKELPSELRDAKKLTSCMSLHFDREEQAWDEDDIKSGAYDIFDYFQPIAPVSLAELWSPFPMAIEILGEPNDSGTAKASWPAYAVFSTPTEDPPKPIIDSVHDKHFSRLLSSCIASATEAKSKSLLLVAMHGWSYRSARRMPAHIRKIMESAGYKCVQRCIFPWWKF